MMRLPFTLKQPQPTEADTTIAMLISSWPMTRLKGDFFTIGQAVWELRDNEIKRVDGDGFALSPHAKMFLYAHLLSCRQETAH